ncbi:IS21-like element helper ATPase IstB [Flammeovirga aprica]|uniref:ATP-binding protein n=1 Tax=Flammeovirga aprica JL-4 TaxID=694437 RepID=A0A7X9XDU8_9BACT|nr:IS21-like element helper ATPase IstB [Flammeovirga aprica]NME73049.1 ATP-binding protein [Flammeovirga aprica JL-4]
MNTTQTIEKMQQMRLLGMADFYKEIVENNLFRESTLDEILGMLIDREWDERRNRKMRTLLKSANFKTMVDTKNILYSSERNLTRNTYERLMSLQFLYNNENIIITGSTGVGKSYLAQVLGTLACRQLHKVIYINCGVLFEKIRIAKVEGSYLNLLKKMERTDLLIIDDFGIHEFNNEVRTAFLDIIEMRYDQSSSIVCSQLPVSKWYDTIGEPTIADAILDRIVNSSHRLDLKGKSLRTLETKE